MLTIRVTTADQNDGTATGGLSLRDAVLTANADLDNEYTIQLQGGSTCNLTLQGSEEDAGRTGDLDIAGNLAIEAVGSGRATINASGLGDRVLDLGSEATLRLERAIVTGGKA